MGCTQSRKITKYQQRLSREQPLSKHSRYILTSGGQKRLTFSSSSTSLDELDDQINDSQSTVEVVAGKRQSRKRHKPRGRGSMDVPPSVPLPRPRSAPMRECTHRDSRDVIAQPMNTPREENSPKAQIGLDGDVQPQRQAYAQKQRPSPRVEEKKLSTVAVVPGEGNRKEENRQPTAVNRLLDENGKVEVKKRRQNREKRRKEYMQYLTSHRDSTVETMFELADSQRNKALPFKIYV